MIKYFHNLTRKEYIATAKKGCTYAELERDYPQPKWCTYPHATEGIMGCWSLIYGVMNDHEKFPIGRKYCKSCDCYNAASTQPKS